MLFVACAALVATLGPQRVSLAGDIGPSLSERVAPADASRPVRFAALQGDPIDSVLKKVSASAAFVCAVARRRRSLPLG